MKKTVIVSIINHKGGVGKTTTVINLAAALTRCGKTVLAVDLDTQMNLTHSLIGDLPESAPCVADLLTNEKTTLASIIHKTNINNLDIVPSGDSMVNLELQLHSLIGREFKLRNCLQNNTAQYDFVLIDNAPHVGLATLNSLIASHCYLVPVSAEYLPLVGLRHLLKTIEQIKPLHPNIQNIGYLLTMVDRRESISSDIEKILRESFGSAVFQQVIRVNTKLKACPQKRQSIFDAEKSSGKGFSDYLKVTNEFLNRLETLYGH